MPDGYVKYRLDSSPSWLLQPNGRAWSTGFGRAEDQELLVTQQGIQARLPDYAPLDAPGTSQALSLIANDRAMQFTFGDDAQLSKTRQWLKSGFTKDALASPLPVNPAAPGWYYAGTDAGLIAALVNSGFYATAADGSIVPPRVYVNSDFYNITKMGLDGWGFAGRAATPVTILGTCLANGTAGANDSGQIVFLTSVYPPANWAANTAYQPGDCVTSPHGDYFMAFSAGTSGASSPFPGSTPAPSTWPPTPGQDIADGPSLRWVYSVWSPIPLAIPVGSWAATFTGSFVSGHPASVTYTPSPPDGRGDAWSRIWLVLPGENLIGDPLLWGNGAGGFDGYWGGPPSGQAFPVRWGATGQISNTDVFGLVYNIAQRWIAGHARFIGAWVVSGASTAIDSIPSGPWNEATDITIGGVQPPFFRYNTELP